MLEESDVILINHFNRYATQCASFFTYVNDKLGYAVTQYKLGDRAERSSRTRDVDYADYYCGIGIGIQSLNVDLVTRSVRF